MDGSQQPIVLRAHKDAVLGAALAPLGLLDATAGQDDRDHEHELWSAAFSADGAYIATVANDHIVRL